MRIGLTGASGVLGRLITERLRKQGYEYFEFEGDIRSKNDVEAWMSNVKFDHVIHLAAMVPVNKVRENISEAYEINVLGTINLLAQIAKANVIKWFFYASTSHVYKSSKNKLNESSFVEPISCYGETKYIAERICRKIFLSENNQPRVCCGRIFSYFHPSQKKPYLYPSILERLESEDLDKPFFLNGANSVRDFLHGDKVADIIINLMDKNATGVVNIASGKGMKIGDFVQSFSGKKLNVISDNIGDYLVADISKLNSILNS